MSMINWGSTIVKALLIVLTISVLILPWQPVSAEQTGSFEGSLTADGKRRTLDFIEGRSVFTFFLEGHVNLTNAVGDTGDFWAEWIGLWDSRTGGTIRCVWDDMHGQKIYVVLSGTQMKEGATLTGEFIGGTGAFKGIQGNFIFTWTTVSFNTGDAVVAGYAKDIKGSYRIP